MYRRFLGAGGLVAIAMILTACPSGTVTPSASASAAAKAPVSAGTSVTAQISDPSLSKPATITFGSVSAPGDVTLTKTTTAPALPAGLTSTLGTVFDISTTAKFDKATVCFEDPKISSRSKIYHYTTTWDDVTSTVAPPRICGDFTSFSPVVIADGTTSAASPTPTATATATTAATATPTAAPSPTATPAPSATEQPTTAPTTAPTSAPTSAPTTAPTDQPTTAPTPSPTVAPTATPSPTPARTFAPPPPTTGLVIYGTVTDSATGLPVDQACVTLGPPIRCFTTTDPNGNFQIDITSIGGQAGITWDGYALRNTVTPKYAQTHWGPIVLNAPTRVNIQITKS